MTSDALRSALEARLGAQYEIQSLLGQGGMGSVFRAMDKTLHRAVAIKVISGDVASNPELKNRFLQEARTVAKLRHPNIVAVYSAGDAEGLLYFVMELVPGESLRELMSREGTVEPARAERILHELALALDYAHTNGIVHRDVKPENILLDRETGRAMLMDFGVARALENTGNMTGTGMILGSPRYMSPEQATGEATLDGRSDLYALALVGYEMFTGKPVVESGNIAGMLVKHLTETPKPLASAAPAVPEGVAVAIDRALTKDRDHRWATGREMAEVIGMAWTPNPASGATRAVAAAKSKRMQPLAFIGIGVAIAASLVAVLISGRERGDPRKSYAVVPFEVQSGNADVQWLRDGAVNMLTLALGQWSDLQVMDYERTLKFVADAGAEDRRVDLDRAQEIARRGGAGTLVMGQVSTTADSLLVVARLYDVRSGRSLTTVTRGTALAADPRPLFDDLARYLLDVAGGATSASVDVARATTTSLTAYRAYLDGVRLLNSWRLTQADSAFRVAIAADSTFALAWHKRALALGWGDGSGPEYLASARRALELSDRLPPRQQALVRGHVGLAEGIQAQISGQPGRASLRESQRIYSELLAQDSLVAEGWYGLADAYFHDTFGNDSVLDAQTRLNRSMRAFHRTLQIDSTFHLAYSHLVQQFQLLSNPGSGAILSGDSALLVQTPAMVAALGGPRALETARARASARAVEITRGWVRADADAVAPHVALATSFVASAQPDSSVAVIDRALQRPEIEKTPLRLMAISYMLLADDPRTAEATHALAQTLTGADLKRVSTNERFSGIALAFASAAALGNGADLDRLLATFAAADPTLPFSTVSTAQAMTWYHAALRAGATGTLSAEQRRVIAGGVREMRAGQRSVLAQMAATSGSVPFVAYLVTRDTLFSNAIRQTMPPSVPHTDLDALEALTRGDTAAARAIASQFTHPDSLGTARFSLAGMRAFARAEVLAAVGNREWAIRYLEALDPRRFSATGFGEAGFATYTRSFLVRGALYEEVGERAKALAAYEEYLRRTALGDVLVEPLRQEARTALARLRDSGR